MKVSDFEGGRAFKKTGKEFRASVRRVTSEFFTVPEAVDALTDLANMAEGKPSVFRRIRGKKWAGDAYAKLAKACDGLGMEGHASALDPDEICFQAENIEAALNTHHS